MPDTITTLLVPEDGDGRAALSDADGIRLLTRGDERRVPASVDCVVDATAGPEPAVTAGVPVVAVTDADAERAGRPTYDAFVRRGDGDRLVETVRWAVARAARAGEADDRTGTDADRANASTADGTSAAADQGSTEVSTSGGGSGGETPHFERLVESMADAVLVADWDGTTRYVNRTAEEALGLSREGLVGEHVSALADAGVVTPAELSELREATADLRDGEEMVTYQMEIAPDDGDPRTIELRAVPTPPTVGVDGVLATIRDVTRRRETERALRDSRERIARLHEAATTIVACRTEDQLFQKAIDAAERVLEFDISSIVIEDEDGEWLTPRAISSGSPEDGARRYRPDEGLAGKTFQTGESYVVDDTAADEDSDPAKDTYRSGISVPVGDHGVFQAVSTETGAFDEDDLELAELLMAHVSETLTRIRVEERLRDREMELVEERDRLAALFENVPDPCVAFDFEDGDPIVRDVNEAFEDVFGYDAETVVGEDIDEYIVPPGYDAEAADLNETLQAGERLQTTSKRLAEDGVRDFLLHVVPFNVGERTVQGYAIYTDITEQKERERTLRRQNEQLDQFASMVSHDLRNPLNVADGYLDLVAETGDPEHVEEVRTAHERMDRMINELLALARRGEIVGETRPTELSEVAAGAWKAVDTGSATFEIADGTVLEADPERLGELLENLFRNAVEHGSTGSRNSESSGDAVEHGSTGNQTSSKSDDAVEHGGPDPSVTVGPLDEGFYVEDDGPGIPEEKRDEVFESGYTTREEGTGFGLSIVEQIASAHDWTVEVTESAQGGARFEFRPDDDGGGSVTPPVAESH